NLITKVYFPRVMVPMSAAGAGLVDFAISGGVLAIALLYFGVWPKLTVLLLPAIVLLLIVAAMGMGILLSALTVHYRDFRHLLTFLMQLWMFATPAIYLPSVGKDLPQGGWWLALNPAQGLIQNFRAAALGLPLDSPELVISAAVGLGPAVLGAYYLRRVGRSFVDALRSAPDASHTNMTNKLSVGVIGYGYWGPNLVRNFSLCPRTQAVAVLDARAERRAAAERMFPHVRGVASLEELLDLRLDAVAIA